VVILKDLEGGSWGDLGGILSGSWGILRDLEEYCWILGILRGWGILGYLRRILKGSWGSLGNLEESSRDLKGSWGDLGGILKNIGYLGIS
jgi:hypothetical protein